MIPTLNAAMLRRGKAAAIESREAEDFRAAREAVGRAKEGWMNMKEE
jgi:hypothetical protein